MDVTINICTHNRARDLDQTLESISKMKAPPDVSWEVLVADNGSNDDTRMVCEFWAKKLPLRRIQVPTRGKSQALNTSLNSAHGHYLLYTDDDVNVAENWLRGMWEATRAYPEAGFIGGEVEPIYEAPLPGWALGHEDWLPNILKLTVEEEGQPVQEKGLKPVGANWLVKAEHARLCGGYRQDLGPGAHGASRVVGEETDLVSRLIEQGVKGVFTKNAPVYHRHDKKRLSRLGFARHAFGYGQTEIRVARPEVRRRCGWVPLYLIRSLFTNILLLIKSLILRDDPAFNHAFYGLNHVLGQLREFRDQSKRAETRPYILSKQMRHRARTRKVEPRVPQEGTGQVGRNRG